MNSNSANEFDDQSIGGVVQGWQKRLLQLDRRNNLLYFKPGRTFTRIVDYSPDRLISKLESSRHGLTFDYAESRASNRRPLSFEVDDLQRNRDGQSEPYVIEGDLRSDCTPVELQRKLGNLRRRAREWQEEQGLNVLALALGMLHWVDEDGQRAEAPLLILPAQLDRPSPRDAYVLTEDEDDISINSTLEVKLSEFGIDLPGFDPAAQNPSDYFAVVKSIISSREDWEVVDTIYLATFAYSKLAMWRDLERIRTEGTDHPIVRTLAGNSTVDPNTTSDPSALAPEELGKLTAGQLDDVLDIRDQHTILDADYSQLIAITGAKSGSNLVIHGPPGTGKSQTIANIIATSIAEGKTVLFVSEKTAALDVVKKRLEECDLGVFCLDMHSERGSKASVYAQLRQSVDDLRMVVDLGFDVDTLSNARTRLNRTVRALHTRRDPLGVTVYDMHGRMAELRNLPHVRFEVRDVGNLTQERFSGIKEIATRIAQHDREFHSHWTSRWWVLRTGRPSLELANLIRRDTEVVALAVRQLEADATLVAEQLGVRRATALLQIHELKRLADHLGQTPNIPAGWMERDVIRSLRKIAEREEGQQQTRTDLLADFSQYFGNSLPDWDYRSLINELTVIGREREAVRSLLGNDFSARIVASDQSSFDSVEQLNTSVAELRRAASELSSLLQLNEPHTLLDVKELTSIANVVLTLNPIPEEWLSPGGTDQIRSEIEKARQYLRSLSAAESQLFERFDPAILNSVDQDMLIRYRTDHQSRLRRLFGQYKNDRKVIRGLSLTSEKLSVDEELSVVQRSLDIANRRREWQHSEERLSSVLGNRFRGRETDWDAIERDVTKTEALQQGWKGNFAGLNVHLTSIENMAEFREAASHVSHWVDQAETFLHAVSPIELELILTGNVGLDRISELLNESLPILRSIRTAIVEPLRISLQPLDGLERLVALLESGAKVREVDREQSEISDSLSKDFGWRYDGFNTDWKEIKGALDWTDELQNILGAERVSTTVQEHCTNPRESDYYQGIAASIEAMSHAYYQQIMPLNERFDLDAGPWDSWVSAHFDDIKDWATDLSENADTASDWIIYLAAVQALEESIGDSVIDKIRSATDVAEAIPQIVERRIIVAWLDWVYSQEPTLSDFRSSSYEEIRSRFADLDRKFPIAARHEIRRKLFSKYPSRFATSSTAGRLGILRGELSKSRKQMPVRSMFRSIPNLIQTLKPCFLLSPLAVSQYLPISDLASETMSFDLVIFDEASQVFPEDSVPAILRGNQVVLAGDQKQLPPSNFWRRSLSDDDDEYDDDDESEHNDQFAGRESVLDVAVGQIGNLFTEAHLNVHYRSKDERLIQFSNRRIYGDRLLTFPSPGIRDSWYGLHDVPVDGVYDAGRNRSRTNRAEAEKVVDLIFEHMRTRPTDESLGVVALSRAQAEKIVELLEQRRLSERDIDHRFDEDAEEPFFVKNLENVQGDERDHMIMSIGYGPTPAGGPPPNRFGPINIQGGERRLNVAITRARRRFAVVRSLKPSDITSASRGARLLRRFIEFVADPVRGLEGDAIVDIAAEPESPFEEAVGRALESRGHRIARQIGVSGYRVDLGILSEDGLEFDLGIECDGATYHSAPAARDRDWLREGVLKNLGWQIHRVWSTSWIRNPKAELDAIEQSLATARAKMRMPIQAQQVTTDKEVGPNRVQQVDEPLEDVEDITSRADVSFGIYEVATFTGVKKGPQLQYETQSNLNGIIARVAEIEGPVHVELAIERIRVLYGLGRIRGNTRSRVTRALESASKNGLIIKQNNFFWANESQLNQPPRKPAHDDSPRRIEHIYQGELEEAVIQTAKAMFGGSHQDIIVQTARNLGYQRTGRSINETVEGVIASLIENGRLRESFGTLVPSD